jgi:hypothetical protein
VVLPVGVVLAATVTITSRTGSMTTTVSAAPDPARRATRALTGIKILHTLVWLSIESCMDYLLYAGLARRTDRRAAIAAAVVAGECLIFTGNGLRCP